MFNTEIFAPIFRGHVFGYQRNGKPTFDVTRRNYWGIASSLFRGCLLSNSEWL
jgi:hypothetical protein